jgi:hypothetical protein
MCDTVAGELILCFTTIDLAARNLVALIRDHKIGHVEYVDSLDNKLVKLNLKPDPDLEFDLHLVRVPSGQESWKTTYLHFFYNHELLKAIPSSAQRFTKVLGRSDYQFTVSPNHLLTVAGSSPPGTPLSAKNFQPGAYHWSTSRLSVCPFLRFLIPTQFGCCYSIQESQLTHHLQGGRCNGQNQRVGCISWRSCEIDAHVVNLSLQFGLLDKGKGCAICGLGITGVSICNLRKCCGSVGKAEAKTSCYRSSGKLQRYGLGLSGSLCRCLGDRWNHKPARSFFGLQFWEYRAGRQSAQKPFRASGRGVGAYPA